MSTPKTDAFVADLRKMLKIASKKGKNCRKTAKITLKTAEKLVKSAEMRVFIGELRKYASAVAELTKLAEKRGKKQ